MKPGALSGRANGRGLGQLDKPEHAVDLDTGVIVAAALHAADQGDTTALGGTLATAENNLAPPR
jgi:hypothetical protein